MTLRGAALATLLGAASAFVPVASQPASQAGCGGDPAFHALDFWLGTWRVTAGGAYAGTDTVTAELGGCAVVERWSDADGGSGMSLFAYDAFSGAWTQTWVTDRATRVGGLKFKTLVARYADGGTRFQGTLPAPPGHRPILDRTTLAPQPDGTVRQIIEQSVDGGDTWKTGFDAVYSPAKP
jgi:hypothetical protein